MVGAWSNPIKPEGLYDKFDHVSTEIIPHNSKNNFLSLIMLIFILFSISTLKNNLLKPLLFHVAHAMYYHAAQPIPFFGYAIRHTHIVSLIIYWVICFKLDL